MAQPDWSRLATPAIGAVLTGILAVFLHAGLTGPHGLGALEETEVRETRLIAELAALEAERAAWANRTARLSESYLDLDLLDERARSVLGYARPDEIILR